MNILNTKKEEIELVSCETCKCLLEKKDAQFVKATGMIVDRYYCQAHRVPYDEKFGFYGTCFYYKRIEVDEEGEPIGYTKTKK